jgi:hypothetical protein
MGKLFNMKPWLTVADAARHLTIAVGEDVTEADVLRLALDGALRLSVRFVNGAEARCGKIVRYSESELKAAVAAGKFPEDLNWTTFPSGVHAVLPGMPDETKGKSITYLMSLRIDVDRYLTLGDKIIGIDEVWDLPLIGNERLDVEHAYQMLTGGPAVTLQCLDGAFVEGKDGQMCQIQESFDDNEYQAGSNAQLEKLKRHIANNNIGGAEAEELLNRHKVARKAFLENRKANCDSGKNSDNYYPGDLPKDSVLVVRTEALQEFEQSINVAPAMRDKAMTATERNTLLTIIAALCKHSKIDTLGRGAAGRIAKLTEELGATVTDDTIRNVLAKLRDVLEARMK